MVHTYEVYVDTREYLGEAGNALRSDTTRYEIAAESRQSADQVARDQARCDNPKATEYEIRVTRLLK